MPEQTTSQDKFDLRTHHFNGRGQLTKANPYRMHVKDGAQLFERPVNSGNLFYENNQPAGRVIIETNSAGKVTSKKFDFEAEHVKYTAPMTGEAKVHFENESLKDENARLKAELEAIRAEKDKKAADAAEKKPAVGSPALAQAVTAATKSAQDKKPEPDKDANL